MISFSLFAPGLGLPTETGLGAGNTCGPIASRGNGKGVSSKDGGLIANPPHGLLDRINRHDGRVVLYAHRAHFLVATNRRDALEPANGRPNGDDSAGATNSRCMQPHELHETSLYCRHNAVAGLPRKDEAAKDAGVHAGIDQRTADEHDDERGHRLDPPAPEPERDRDARTKPRAQKRQHEDKQAHGDAEDEERLETRQEPSDAGGKGCDRSQKGNGSADAYGHEPRPEQVAPTRRGPANGLLPGAAAQGHDPPH